jgi:PhoH-like ATPase
MYDLKEEIVSASVIDKIHKSGKISLDSIVDDSYNFYLLKTEDESKTALASVYGNELVKVNTKDINFQGLKPRDARQACMFWSLTKFDLFVALGSAGTGKTTVSLAYALNEMFRKDKPIVLCKPTVFVGQKSNAIGAIPGDHREKMEGYIESYLTSLRKILGDSAEHHLYQMEEEQKLQFVPLELMRGQHFENCTMIIDEAQNTSAHELMSVISRVGDNSTVIVLGDPAQIDTGTRYKETGLHALCESDAFFECPFATGIKLLGQYRGPMATLASDVLKELQEDEEDDSLDNYFEKKIKI